MYGPIETRILERLRDTLPEGVSVQTVEALEEIPQLRQKAPTVVLVYQGYIALDKAGQGGMVQLVRQQWLAVCVTRSSMGKGAGDQARMAASDLAEDVTRSLLGYQLGGGRFLRLADAPGPEYDAGFVYLPLSFTNAATFKGLL
jgi:hypothetical protein